VADVDVGAKVVELRKRASMTQAELAERTGLRPPYLSQIETGKRTGKVKTLRKISDALGVPLSAIVDEDGGSLPVMTDEELFSFVGDALARANRCGRSDAMALAYLDACVSLKVATILAKESGDAR
jgi:transcriptional regulator with XRE-family HTH domain